MGASVVFEEIAARHAVESIPMAHLSIELGHLYARDFGAGNDRLKRYFERIAPTVRRAQDDCTTALPRGGRARISTCFLIDDYFNEFGQPGEVIEVLRRCAEGSGLTIDYIARERGCAVADDIDLARLVLDRIVVEPPQGTTGSRPPVTESGWLSNGQRSPTTGEAAPAMKAASAWVPPLENGPSRHSIFMDVQLFSETNGTRTWSCCFLASIWQLMRLGVLRHMGNAAVRPMRVEPDYLDAAEWRSLPAVLQVNPDAAPFSAYRTMSVLQNGFLNVEAAVRMILSQVPIDLMVADQIAKRTGDEGLDIPTEIVRRIGYVFTND